MAYEWRKPYVDANTLPKAKREPIDKAQFNAILNERLGFSDIGSQTQPAGTLGPAADALTQSEFKKPYARNSKGYQKMEHGVWNPPYNLYPNHGGRGYGSYPSLLGYGEQNEPNPLRDLGLEEFTYEWKLGPYWCKGAYGGYYDDVLYVAGPNDPVITKVKMSNTTMEIVKGRNTDTATIRLDHEIWTSADTKRTIEITIRLNTGETFEVKDKAIISPWY